MKVRAMKTDSWLGTTFGEVYNATVYKGSFGERTMVHTDGYTVLFNEDDFVIVNDKLEVKEATK